MEGGGLSPFSTFAGAVAPLAPMVPPPLSGMKYIQVIVSYTNVFC